MDSQRRSTLIEVAALDVALNPAFGVVPSWSGAPDEGEAQIAPFPTLADPLVADMAQRPFSEALSLFDGPMTDRHHVSMETCWIAEMEAACIEVLVRQAERRPSPACAIVTHQFHGEAERVLPQATAFGIRRSDTLVEIVTHLADPASTAEPAWAVETITALAPFALLGAYANLQAPGDPRAGEAYGRNAARLRALKDCHDPDGLFSSTIPLPTNKGA
ncbi:hypothetical protein FHS96_005201 [Sphingomonas zeicaulis]|uniref:hypothetical protein n=1 Tax=Sphingomonas zeicaulis TaxID=1632740 RepID=UPI003D1CDF64